MARMDLLLKAKDFLNRKVLRRKRDLWNYRYSQETWSSLGDVHELARFSVIAGYAQFLKPHGRFLEMGAGEGHLQQRFDRTKYELYHATDVSEVAIAHARKYEDAKTKFLVGDMNSYVPETDFDCIIINEAIYYGPSVQKVLDRLAPFLKANGIFVISINGDAHNRIWHDMVDQCSYPLIDGTVLKCTRNIFRISVFGKRR